MTCKEEEVLRFANDLFMQADLIAVGAVCQNNAPKKIEVIDVVAM